MAVLKSPRNTRKKNKWVKKYCQSQKITTYKMEDKKSSKVSHKFDTFLLDSQHWLNWYDESFHANENTKETHYEVNETTTGLNKPKRFVRYSTRRTRLIDTLSVSPLIAMQSFPGENSKRKFIIFTNSVQLLYNK